MNTFTTAKNKKQVKLTYYICGANSKVGAIETIKRNNKYSFSDATNDPNLFTELNNLGVVMFNNAPYHLIEGRDYCGFSAVHFYLGTWPNSPEKESNNMETKSKVIPRPQPLQKEIELHFEVDNNFNVEVKVNWKCRSEYTYTLLQKNYHKMGTVPFDLISAKLGDDPILLFLGHWNDGIIYKD